MRTLIIALVSAIVWERCWLGTTFHDQFLLNQVRTKIADFVLSVMKLVINDDRIIFIRV